MVDLSEIGKPSIRYSQGYKYQLRQDYWINVGIKVEKDAISEYVCLYRNGLLFIREGYAWDGASGPTWDDKHNMRGGLVHDACYQLIRLGLIPTESKKQADLELKTICKEDGMSSIRAWYYHKAVETFGGKSCKVGYEPYPVLVAP